MIKEYKKTMQDLFAELNDSFAQLEKDLLNYVPAPVQLEFNFTYGSKDKHTSSK